MVAAGEASGRIVWVGKKFLFFLSLDTGIMQVIARLPADCAAGGGEVTVLRNGGKEVAVAEEGF